MLAMNSYSRRYRMPCTSTTGFPINGPGNIMSRPRLPLRCYTKPKSTFNLASLEPASFGRSKRFKSRKINGCQKIDAIKKKTIPDCTENAYREAVSKLKYLLAESYAPRPQTGKLSRDRAIYRRSNNRINETPEDSDDRSLSECSRSKGLLCGQFDNANSADTENNRRQVGTSQISVFPSRDTRSPVELTSFVARQEEYIEQLERESEYRREELKNLLEKIREVVAENDALHEKNKPGLLKNFLREFEITGGNNKNFDKSRYSDTDVSTSFGIKSKTRQIPDVPNIIFESRISELEAQLTQARIELKKSREDNDSNAKRLAEICGNSGNPECGIQLDQTLREKRELGGKLEEALRSLQSARDRENEMSQKARRSTELAQQAEFEKYQADAEIRRLNDELDRQREKFRGISQDASRRVVEERNQVERRFGQQVEQLSADVASHWDAASKSLMETEKQRRELGELKRDLAQKQATIEDLKKELQNKISNLQSDLSRVTAEKDAAEQEVAAANLAIERNERQARQEQSRWQVEINSYKQRLERADADVLHCRRENLRLSEQIASLEKELNLSKSVRSQDVQKSATTTKSDGEKDLTTMIMDMETKQEEAVGCDDGGGINFTTTPSKKKRTVKVDLKVKVTPKKKSIVTKTIKLPLSAQEEMANLQSNIEYISSKINDALEKKEVEQAPVSDRNNAQHSDEIIATKMENPPVDDYPTAEPEPQSYPNDYVENPDVQLSTNENVEYPSHRDNVVTEEPEIVAPAIDQDYNLQDEQKYEAQEYQAYPAEYSNQDYAQYEQYDPSMYEQNPSGDVGEQLAGNEGVAYQQDQQQYEEYPAENYPDDQSQQLPTDQHNFGESTTVESTVPEA